MLVGVISDTHSYMDARALQLLQGVDHILHAGDIGDARIIKELQGIAPVTAVRGNVDREPTTSLYPAEETLELEGYRIFLTHEVKPPKRETDLTLEGYRQAGVDVVVYGHSHIAYQQRWEGILFFNPGAAGKRRFKVIPSIGFLTLTRTGVEGMVTPLEVAEGPGLPVMPPPSYRSGR
ncbi:MAG: metallophosphoesterase family protein [Chloroflexi bacterium]|nr:metallophosphoesterase family protein [Chloroflexota bacterium]